ncbi:DUF1015 domain-containing protein [Clostridium sp. LIBA-8841]|uniref:DUF1015 domain-containing protein n=1 Tax=Clostridium sp. LIBA-8841 TaxID=2987530 RepID=UPI002AC76DF8|nr:DUF1015 family protein [Clostridium sp. LIBA-8841]MDZ5255361.1 DUF1015 family protein [Clostridium sp. LIBA-8841]
MVNIKAFRALRPKCDLVEKVAALPYDVLDREEAREIVKNNEFSFLNVDKAEVYFPGNVSEYSEEVYKKAGENLENFIKNKVFIKEEKDCLYVYELSLNGQSQKGIVSCLAVDDYLNNTIKKHEFTRAKKEADRINHIKACNAQTGPIFLTYRDSEKINNKVSQICSEKPLYDFIADDGVFHRVWKIDDEDIINEVISDFKEVNSVYIADGHHRSEAAVKVCLERREDGQCLLEDECNYFLGVLFPKTQLSIMDYNRVVRDLNGLSEEEFISKIEDKFQVTKVNEGEQFKPQNKGEFGMYLNNQWFKLKYLSKEDDVVKNLDVSILQNNILEPILGIRDVRNDERIDFVGGIRGLKELEKRVYKDMKIAFALYPTSLEEVMEISDQELIMPPKSTWFEPKLRSGIFIHEI